jgi:hypothetical protein
MFREATSLLMKVGLIMMVLSFALVIAAPPPLWEEGRQPHFGSEGDDLLLRKKEVAA